ncbi:MFS family permease [Bacillus tianshenii]|uniref:MFS family permease n=1 Tax=Sutcliffiella tianshenii TaxID=1463404 RepID=A0ABS2P4W2_9BACI|nr:MFS transporter [Bacillus tianshenii]MBM7622000.1 MFS family permease [Bacillus tianshenii]
MNSLETKHIYYTLHFLISLASAIMFTTYAIYYIEELGLNPFQLILIGTFLEVTIILFEGITGVVADTYSRRFSVITATFILGGAFILEGSIPYFSDAFAFGALAIFASLLVAEIIRGLGETFLSGADQAWLADEAGEGTIAAIFVRANQLRLVASLIGIVVSVVLASFALNLPYIVGGGIYVILGIFLCFFMKEHKFERAPAAVEMPFRAMKSTFVSGIGFIKKKPILWMLLLVTVLMGAASEGVDRLWEAHLLEAYAFPELGNLSPVVWFGIIHFVGTLISIGAMEWYQRKFDVNKPRVIRNSLFYFTLGQIAFTIIFGLASSFYWAIFSFWVLGIIGSITAPIYQTWLNQQLESGSRATVLSIMGQGNAVGQGFGGPFVGVVATRFYIRSAIVLSGLLIIPAAVLYGKVRKGK